jgi:hypothetical protein
MIGAYVASMVVTLVQYVRLRDRKLLPLLALFAFQAIALSRDWWDYEKELFQTAACASGLVLLLVLTLGRPASPPPAPPSSPPATPPPDAPPAPPASA